jgi:short-subunit dehydrogenase
MEIGKIKLCIFLSSQMIFLSKIFGNNRKNMDKPTVLITGCGYKPIGHVFEYEGKPTYNGIMIDGKECKMNIGTAIAYYLSQKGIKVIMVSNIVENLEKIKQGLVQLGCDKNLISYIATDLLSNDGVENLIKELPENETIYWVQSLGMGGGTYKVPNDNIYLPFEKIEPELIENEMKIVSATHRIMLKIIPVFRKQIKNGKKAKISIITSMSGERGYHFGATHVAAKHALVGYIEGIRRELNDEGIEIYDIRPGAIDTGMYDNPHVKQAIEELSKRDDNYSENNHEPVYAPPLKVAEAVHDSLFNKNPQRIYRVLALFQK